MAEHIPFMDRLKTAWRILVDAAFAAEVERGLAELEARKKPVVVPPERVHASALMLLAGFQREGRLMDFLQQEVAGFTDSDIGAAARIVHGGCRKILAQFFSFEPAVKGTEGAPMTVPAGFDAQRIRLTGNVTGQAPFKGILKHQGWVSTDVRMPLISESLDPRVVAPAELELS